jgi:hypothetical protein
VNLKNRIEKLEGKTLYRQDKWENVRVVVGEEEAKKANKELEDQGLEGVVIIVENEETKKLTERLLGGE